MKYQSNSIRLRRNKIVVYLFLLSLCLCRQATAGWQTETIDSTGNVGEFTSLVFDPISGNPAISYFDAANRDLKFARFNGTLWEIATVDSAGDVGLSTSLAFDPISGNPAISYMLSIFDPPFNNFNIKFAIFNGTSWIITTVDSTGEVLASFTSLAFDTSGNPAIAYQDNPSIVGLNPNLTYAHFNGVSWDINSVFSVEGLHGSLAFNSSGNPAISFYASINDDLVFAHFNGTSWEITTVDSAGDVGSSNSLAFDLLGNPTISYYDFTNDDLKFARFVPDIPTTTTTTTTTTSTTTTTFVCRCPAAGCISGTVTEIDTEEPLAGKSVILKRVSPKRPIVRKRVVTNDEGCYLFTGLEDGRYRVKAKRCRGGGRQIVVIEGGAKVNDVNFECKE